MPKQSHVNLYTVAVAAAHRGKDECDQVRVGEAFVTGRDKI